MSQNKPPPALETVDLCGALPRPYGGFFALFRSIYFVTLPRDMIGMVGILIATQARVSKYFVSNLE